MDGTKSTSRLPPVTEWPKFSDASTPYLCLKRDRDEKAHGFLLAGSYNVNVGYVWDGGDGYEIPYDSEEALLADGWYVD